MWPAHTHCCLPSNNIDTLTGQAIHPLVFIHNGNLISQAELHFIGLPSFRIKKNSFISLKLVSYQFW